MRELCSHTQDNESFILVCLFWLFELRRRHRRALARRSGKWFKHLIFGGREFRASLLLHCFGPFGVLAFPPFFWAHFIFLFMFILYIHACNNHQLSTLGSVARRLACNPKVRGSTPSPFCFFSFSLSFFFSFVYLFIILHHLIKTPKLLVSHLFSFWLFLFYINIFHQIFFIITINYFHHF